MIRAVFVLAIVGLAACDSDPSTNGGGNTGVGGSAGSSSSSGNEGGQASCPDECVAAYQCVAKCGDTPTNNGCCPCPAGQIEVHTCQGQGGDSPGGGGAGSGAGGGSGLSCQEQCSLDNPGGEDLYAALTDCVVCHECFTTCSGGFLGCADPGGEPSACDQIGTCGDPTAPGDPEAECIACALAGACADEDGACNDSFACQGFISCFSTCQ